MTPTLPDLAQQQQPVTELPARLLWTAVVLAALLLLYYLLWRGWRGRAARQQDVPPLPEPPTEPPTELSGLGLASAEGIYVSTTRAGDWLDRVVVHGLGVRSRCVLTVGEDGVLFERDAAPDLYIPAPALRAVRRDRGIAGAVVEEDGLVVLTWQHGVHLLDTGFRSRHVADRAGLVDAISSICAEEAR